jgi:hypothetical protein
VLEEGDVLSFGAARCRVGGIPREDIAAEVELRRSASPELTRRELDVLTSLCRPALSDEAFVAPATAREIAADLVVTEAAVKQHLLRLYQKFRIPEGQKIGCGSPEVVALGWLSAPAAPPRRAERPTVRRGRPRQHPRRTPGMPPAAAPETPRLPGTKRRGHRRQDRPDGVGAAIGACDPERDRSALRLTTAAVAARARA